MARVPPDTNDGYVWLLSEISGAYRNSGSILPNDPSTDLSITNTVIRTNTGVYGGNCPWFPGLGTYPSGASATRNYIAGANNINPSPPFTVSCWVFLRQYNGSNTTHVIGKAFRDPTQTTTWVSPFFAVEMTITNNNGGGDLYHGVAQDVASQVGRTITEFPIPLHQWSHIGITHDGTAIRSYLNGCQLMTYSGATQLLSTASTTVAYQDIGYNITNAGATGTYISGVTDIGNHGDEVVTTVNLPFPVTVYGVTFNTINCSSNGFVEFLSTANAFNFSLPNGSLGIVVNVFERDCTTSGAGLGIFTTTVGSVGSRTFVVEFRMNSLAGGTINCEIKFFENSTTFETVYTTSTTANTGSIGIQSFAGAKSTIFSNASAMPAVNTRLVFTPVVNFNPGPWILGAVAATGSSTKEEANYSIQDVRIANVVRPLSYFKNIYNIGVTPLNLSPLTRYYKLRAYDTSCATPTPVVWVDTQISLANAPAFPCSGPYSVPEVIDTWLG